MGMFDTFEGKYTCPRCGFKLKEDFQSKDAGCHLQYYKLGKNTLRKTYGGKVMEYLADGTFNAYTDIVHECKGGWIKEWVDAKAHVKNSIYTKIDQFKITESWTLTLVKDKNGVKIFNTKDHPICVALMDNKKMRKWTK